MRQQRVFLTDDQKEFIISNHKGKTIGQLSEKLKIPYNRIHKFTVREGLNVKKKKRKEINHFIPEGCFDPHERENWLV